MTGDSGVTLGLDLAELYRAGSVFLPAVADEFASAAAAVSNVSGSAAPLFDRDPIFGGSKGPAYAEWEELRAMMGSYLHDTTENLRDVGRALVLAANNYASTDGAAKAELDRLKTEWKMP
jgi:hypothetical protein